VLLTLLLRHLLLPDSVVGLAVAVAEAGLPNSLLLPQHPLYT
jgi:hypothetical protein